MSDPTALPDIAPSHAVVHRQVTDADTAKAVGSGSLDVLGTPVLIAWCEAATVEAVAGLIGEGTTTVGTRIEISHLRPSLVGADVQVTATATEVDGRSYTFEVAAESGGQTIARGQIARAAVQVDRFMASARSA